MRDSGDDQLGSMNETTNVGMLAALLESESEAAPPVPLSGIFPSIKAERELVQNINRDTALL